MIENNSRLIFFARAVDGRHPRIVGEFNAWAEDAEANDATAGFTTAIGESGWSYLETTAFTNARMEYVLLFEEKAIPDPLNPRTGRKRHELRAGAARQAALATIPCGSSTYFFAAPLSKSR